MKSVTLKHKVFAAASALTLLGGMGLALGASADGGHGHGGGHGHEGRGGHSRSEGHRSGEHRRSEFRGRDGERYRYSNERDGRYYRGDDGRYYRGMDGRYFRHDMYRGGERE